MSGHALSWAYKQTTGSAAAKAVLVKLADNANDAGVCWPSIERIATETELGRRTVNRKLKELEEAGFLSVRPRREGQRQATNVYQLHLNSQGARAAPSTSQSANGALQGATGASQGVTDDTLRVSGWHPNPHREPPLEEPPREPPSVSLPAKRDSEEGFERWWSHVPKKVGKGAARRAYANALKKAIAEVLLDKMKLYAAARAGQDPHYTKHPATWLNAECWLDEDVESSGDAGDPLAQARIARERREQRERVRS